MYSLGGVRTILLRWMQICSARMKKSCFQLVAAQVGFQAQLKDLVIDSDCTPRILPIILSVTDKDISNEI